MATINNFVGWATGGTEETSEVFGAFSVQSSVVRTGTYALQLDANASVQVNPFDDVADAGDDQIVGFAVRFTDTTPLLNATFLSCMEGLNAVLGLRILTTGDLELLDSLGAVVATVALPFTVDTWHYVELRWQHLDSGTATVFVDGVSKISVTAKDFSQGATFDDYEFENLFGTGMTTYFDDIYMLSGATGDGDFLGKLTEVVGAYQKTDGGATELGSALDVGTWALASQTPADETAGNLAIYTGDPLTGGVDCNSGTRSGPSGDARIDGDSNIKAGKWIWRLSRGSGGGSTHEIRYGNSGDGLTNRNVSPSPSMKTFVKVSVAATEVPLSTETFQMGMAIAGPRDLELGNLWATLLHVADAPADVSLDQVGAHQII